MTTKPQRTQWAILSASLLFLSIVAVPAQGLLQAEFRIDGGAAQPMSVTASNTNGTNYVESSFVASVTASNLSVGPHWLELRMKGGNDVWCEWQSMWFRIAGETHLVAAEFFVDADPSAGLGTSIPLPLDGAWDEPEEDIVVNGVSVTNLSVGMHQLIIRCKDSNGHWGITSQTAFYVGAPLHIMAAVWTTNASDWGNPNIPPPATNSMRASDNLFDEAEEEVQATVNTLALGTNYCLSRPIFVRVQDSLGRWSTRGGLYWDSGSAQWLFDPMLGWTDVAQGGVVVAPQTPSVPSPGDKWLLKKIPADSLTLTWANCAGISSYDLYGRASVTEPFTLWQGGLTTNSFAFSPPLVAGSYQWFVRSLGGNECYSEGPVWQFTTVFSRPDVLDVDNDGIDDNWERQYFGVLQPSNGTTDWDGDGVPDWQEWVSGTGPLNDAERGLKIACGLGSINLFLQRPASVISWNAITNRTYTIYYTNQLTTMGPWGVLDQVAGRAGELSYTNDWPAPVEFYRMDVSLPSPP